MKPQILFSLVGLILIVQCKGPAAETREFDAISRVDSGVPSAVMLTAYSTTLLANGTDQTRLRIAVTDSLGREITSAGDSIRLVVTGDAIVKVAEGESLSSGKDTTEHIYYDFRLEHGVANLLLVAGTQPGRVKVEARSGKLWPGSHEIHTLPAGFELMKPTPEQITPATRPVDRMIGADISFLPQLEDRGLHFFDNGEEKDVMELLRDHGFNYIRLRIFVNPENVGGYTPGTGYCGLPHTLEMAKRINQAGMKLFLDFHYSDYWADPQQQNKPLAWAKLDVETLKDSVKAYTTRILLALKDQGTLPAMVQIGNEINHGILWPEGHISHPDQLAGLLMAGVEGVRAVDPNIPVMMHLALGGQHDEAVFWLDNMIARGLQFDVIGLSYYPRWHGTLEDLQMNLRDLAGRYQKPVNVAEYSNFKKEVHEIVFALPGDMGKGACIWEPLSWHSDLFTKEGKATEVILVYDDLNKRYLNETE